MPKEPPTIEPNPCPSCGYAITATGVATCPECGLVVDVPAVASARDRFAERMTKWIGWLLLARVAAWCIGNVVSYLPAGQNGSGSGRNAAVLIEVVPQIAMLIAGILLVLTRLRVKRRRLMIGIFAAAAFLTTLSIGHILYVAGRALQRIASIDWEQHIVLCSSLLVAVAVILLQPILLDISVRRDPLRLVPRLRKALTVLAWFVACCVVALWILTVLAPLSRGGSPFVNSSVPKGMTWTDRFWVWAGEFYLEGVLTSLKTIAWLVHGVALGVLLLALTPRAESQSAARG